MKIEIKIKNKTAYSTKDLRKLILASIKYFNSWIGRFDPVYHLTVEVVYKRSGTSRLGCAYYNQRWMRLYLNRHPGVDRIKTTRVAQTIVHELEHCIGKKHNEMCDNYDLSFADGITIKFKIPEPSGKLKRGSIEYYEDHIQRLLDRNEKWMKKYHRAKNALGDISSIIKYYEKQLAYKKQVDDGEIKNPGNVAGNK